MTDSSYILPALALLAVLCGLRARIDVYRAFVSGALEGMKALADMLPYLCAVLTAAALLRVSGVMSVFEALCTPVFSLMGLPAEAAGVILLRPLSGSASLAAVKEVMEAAGPDSRAARICCMVCAASETVFFTGSLYMGAAGIRRSGWIIPAALIAYGAGVMAAGWITL